MKRRLGITLGLSLALTLALAAAGQETGAKPPAPSAAEQAAMQKMMEAATPGPAHQKLKPMIGTWDAKVTTWAAPGAPPLESYGTMTNQWILGGRWIEMKFHGSFMGMPFHGLGYTGYDNVQKKYVGTWMDNMSTGVMLSEGEMDSSGKSIEFIATVSDPLSGTVTESKETMTIVDDDHHTMEMWGPGPDGKSYRMMVIEYTRKK